MEKRVAVALAAGLALASGALAALELVALEDGGAVRLGPLPPLEMALGYDQAAEKALAASPSDLVAAEAASRRGLALTPYNNGARLRLVYIETLHHGGLDDGARHGFQTSYDLVANDPEYGLWRVQFGLDHWDTLTPSLRTAVGAEAQTLLNEPNHNRKLTGAIGEVRNPAGRLAGAIWLSLFNRHSAAKASVP